MFLIPRRAAPRTAEEEDDETKDGDDRDAPEQGKFKLNDPAPPVPN